MALNDFHVSEPYTLGIELEMQVVNPHGYDLSQDSSTLIDAVKPQLTAGEIKHDITESMLEMATGVCRDIDQSGGSTFCHAARYFTGGVGAPSRHLRRRYAPFSKWQRQEVCDNERYQRTLENFGYLIQQATVLVSMSTSVARTATMRFIFYTGCRILCRTLLRSPPRLLYARI